MLKDIYISNNKNIKGKKKKKLTKSKNNTRNFFFFNNINKQKNYKNLNIWKNLDIGMQIKSIENRLKI